MFKRLFSILLSFSLLLFSFATNTNQVHAETKKNDLTVYYENPKTDQNLGFWLFGDGIAIEDWSQHIEDWPKGAYDFSKSDENFLKTEVKYLDKENIEIEYLIIDKDTGNKEFEDDAHLVLHNNKIEEIWIDKHNNIHYMEPSIEENVLRLYLQTDSDEMTAWFWGGKTHDDMLGKEFDRDRVKFDGRHQEFIYWDVKLNDSDEKDVGFLFHDGSSQTGDYEINIHDYQNPIYTRFDSTDVFNQPFFDEVSITSGVWVKENQIELTYKGDLTDTSKLKISLRDTPVSFNVVSNKNDTLLIEFDDTKYNKDEKLVVTLNEEKFEVSLILWTLKDDVYATDETLGLTWEGDKPNLKFWSPSADAVSIEIYDTKEAFIKSEPMENNNGIWSWKSSDSDLKNKYYQLKITRDGTDVYALDPYAKSMAPWNGLDFGDCDTTKSECVAKAAFVDPSDVKNKTGYAEIVGYEDREDAIIYEMHVRDFTSDESIESDLNGKRFGTFDAFIEKLDYVENLGVTHIQLLPIMSYYFADELNVERVTDPTLQGKDSNYNWGYDPHSYFSITGMYSEDVQDPSLRIKEFKNLVDEIHERGMGVILDVVYNHTARTHIFEDLEPNYYHFMDEKGNTKTSFGGGRLGTTHEMARRILVDSIIYWTEEFMVDGFRFDMMGDHDAESIQIAYDKAKELNPKTLFLGEGWVTYEGDSGFERPQAADQSWMTQTSDVGVFSDEMRNMMKSGFPNEGSPEFLSGGAQNISKLFDNIKAQPHNFTADEPKDVVTYLEAHDNLTLHDVIAISIKKSPQEAQKEILQRQRLGNLVMFTSQGTMFVHSGQEYGRTRQVFADNDQASKMDKTHILKDKDGNLIENPYFVSDAYNSSDGINRFDWDKALNSEEHVKTREYTEGLIKFRKETDVFRLKSKADVDKKIQILETPSIQDTDLAIAYKAVDKEADYYVLINADDSSRSFEFDDEILEALKEGVVIADQDRVDVEGLKTQKGFKVEKDKVVIDALTGIIIKTEPIAERASEEKIIFHAWNWSFNEIKDNLKSLKNAGFDAIQTSPVQPIKPENGLTGDKWWLLYQPTDFAFGETLGTKEEFKNMAQEAKEQDVEIIVDVVLNHLANDEGGDKACIPSIHINDRFKDEHWHEAKCVTDYKNREQITQQGIGLPDLNTQHEDIQNWASEFLNELIDLGATGLRFDAAKHIELPNDSGPQGDFWPNVLGSLKENVYLYGEVLQDENDEFVKYSKIFDVTASNYGYTLKDAIEGNGVSGLVDYRTHAVKPKNLVTWVESHDTYANDNGATTHLTNKQINLGWSVLAARKDHNPLYFNRPNQDINDKFATSIGEKGQDNWKDESLQLLHTFRKDMEGTSEYLRYPNDKSVMIERSNEGVVITNFDKKPLKLERFNTGLADGIYSNVLNENQSFTIENGKITGEVDAESFVILYTKSELPIIDIHYDEVVTIEVKNHDEAFYRINNSDWKAIDGTVDYEIDESAPYYTETNIEVKATNKHGTQTRAYTHRNEPRVSKSVYFKKPSDWDEKVNLYVYDAPGEILGSWPGTPMEYMGHGWYRYEFDDSFETGRILFNDDQKQYPASGEDGLFMNGRMWIDENFEIHESNPDVDAKELHEILKSIRNQKYAIKLNEKLFKIHDRSVESMLDALSQEEIDEITENLIKKLENALTQETEEKILDNLPEKFIDAFEKTETEEEGLKLLNDIQKYLENEKPEDEEKDPEDEDTKEDEESNDQDDENEKPGDDEEKDSEGEGSKEDDESSNQDEESTEQDVVDDPKDKDEEKDSGKSQGPKEDKELDKNDETTKTDKLPSTGTISIGIIGFTFIATALYLKYLKKKQEN